jgi:Lon protease-like protein
MSINTPYGGPDDVPAVIPIFPLESALLLPRGQLPLNVFEPRYIAMLDDVIKSHRVIGMVQPDAEAVEADGSSRLFSIGCAGRVTQFAETGDGRYLVTLTGIARYRIVEEIAAVTPYRQCRVDFTAFEQDFEPAAGEEAVDRDGVLKALGNFADANQLQIDWKSVREAPNESLVNALSMMSPYGPKEKQALLEAPDLRSRADVLIAITEVALARGSQTPRSLQ